MNNDKDLDTSGVNGSKESNELDRINDAITGRGSDADTNSLEDDIVRNDTIPETSKNTPGSSGAFPVGAFDTSKD